MVDFESVVIVLVSAILTTIIGVLTASVRGYFGRIDGALKTHDERIGHIEDYLSFMVVVLSQTHPRFGEAWDRYVKNLPPHKANPMHTVAELMEYFGLGD